MSDQIRTELLGSNEIFVHNFGDKNQETMILINGFGRSTAHWCGFQDSLAKYFSVYGADNPGMGKSTRPMKFESMTSVADAIGQKVIGNGSMKFHVVGLSMGGIIARQLTKLYPENIRTMTLINTPSRIWWTKTFNFIAAIKMAWADFINKEGSTTTAEMLISPHCNRIPEIAKEWAAIERKSPTSVLAMIKQIISIHLHREDFVYPIVPPTLIIKSSEDLLVPQYNSDKLAAKIPGSSLIEVVGGHEVTTEIPDEIADFIHKFVRKQS